MALLLFQTYIISPYNILHTHSTSRMKVLARQATHLNTKSRKSKMAHSYFPYTIWDKEMVPLEIQRGRRECGPLHMHIKPYGNCCFHAPWWMYMNIVTTQVELIGISCPHDWRPLWRKHAEVAESPHAWRIHIFNMCNVIVEEQLSQVWSACEDSELLVSRLASSVRVDVSFCTPSCIHWEFMELTVSQEWSSNNKSRGKGASYVIHVYSLYVWPLCSCLVKLTCSKYRITLWCKLRGINTLPVWNSTSYINGFPL